MNKTDAKIVGVKFSKKDLEVMKSWAKEHRLPLSWVVRRCVEIGLPTFLDNPIERQMSTGDAA